MEETHEASAREFTVQNRMGIHTRPAAQIVRLANRYPDVEITVSKDDESVNGKSIMGLMMLLPFTDSSSLETVISQSG